jgi:hypothetical protein
MSKLLVTAVCAALAFPTVSLAQDYGHGARPPGYRYGGGQHSDHNGGQGHYDGHHNSDGGNHQYNYGSRYPYYGYNQPHYRNYYYGGYRPYYGGYQPYYYGHSHHDGNDDALWAIGGLVLGGIIGSAIEHANQYPPATTAAPPPVAQQQRYCDRIEYDSAGNPYVERSCNR